MEEPRTGELEGAKQGAERARMEAFDFQWGAAVFARGARVEKRINLALEHTVLDGGEELLRLGERQAQMLNTSVVFLQDDEIGDGFFLAIIITKNELQFDAHEECSSG
jgi:hypothetical protein